MYDYKTSSPTSIKQYRKDNNLDMEVLASKLANIYSAYENGLLLNADTSNLQQYFDLLNKEIDIKEFVDNNLDLFANRLNQCSEIGYYKHSFIYFAYNIIGRR